MNDRFLLFEQPRLHVEKSKHEYSAICNAIDGELKMLVMQVLLVFRNSFLRSIYLASKYLASHLQITPKTNYLENELDELREALQSSALRAS